jgi:glycosyltransferase involved in cell wall biosynthesis
LLDTIHYSGGNSTHEALATGTPIVTMPSPYVRGRLTLGRLKKINVLDTVVNSPSAYVDMAVRLGTDPAFRDQIKAKILAANNVLYDDPQAVREFEQFFRQAIECSGVKIPAAPRHAQVFDIDFDGVAMPQTRPSVSLCMIVKNEEDNLADCLASVGDFPTEIVIVDTGSTDRTVEIARQFGARVEHFEWVDDFAAARNESLKYAAADWVFWLDADDRLPPESVVKLKQAVASEQADAYRCRMVSKIDGDNPTVSTVYYTLLFRNHRGIQFDDPLHESPTANILGQGMTVAHTNIFVNHTGYSGGPEQLKNKAHRNMKILQRCVADQPDNMKWQYHLGLTSYQLEDYAAAVEALERVVTTPSPMLEQDTHIHRAYKLLISAYTSLSQPALAEEALRRALAVFPDRRHVWITGGLLYLYLNRPEKAIELLTHARTLSPESDAVGDAWASGFLEEQLTTAYHTLGMKALRQHNYTAAVGIFAEMSETAPPTRQAEAYKLLAMALQKNGQKEEAVIAWQAAQRV